MFARSSGGKGTKNFGRWGSLKDKRVVSNHGSQLPINNSATNQRLSTDSDSVMAENVQTFQRAALYVLGEKAQMKVNNRAKLIASISCALVSCFFSSKSTIFLRE